MKAFLIVIFSPCPNRANTAYIVKYNLQKDQLEAQIPLTGYIPRSATYGWGGYSGVDLAVDEKGLWVLWAIARGLPLKASKIDAKSNRIMRTWTLNTGIRVQLRYMSKKKKSFNENKRG